MESSSSVVVTNVKIKVDFHHKTFDALEVTKTAEVQQILGDVALSSPPLAERFVLVDIKIVETELLTNELAKLDTFCAIAVFVKLRSIGANSHNTRDDDHDCPTYSRFCW